MKKIMIAILVLFTFSCLLGCGDDYVVASSDQNGKESAESIVTCLNGGNYLVLAQSVSGTINLEQCKFWEPDVTPDPCADCIISLEDQGCVIVDVVVSGLAEGEVAVTYLLSCDGR